MYCLKLAAQMGRHPHSLIAFSLQSGEALGQLVGLYIGGLALILRNLCQGFCFGLERG
ncbi:hypothetical protein D3C84_1148490 [compost metagenome]